MYTHMHIYIYIYIIWPSGNIKKATKLQLYVLSIIL